MPCEVLFSVGLSYPCSSWLGAFLGLSVTIFREFRGSFSGCSRGSHVMRRAAWKILPLALVRMRRSIFCELPEGSGGCCTAVCSVGRLERASFSSWLDSAGAASPTAFSEGLSVSHTRKLFVFRVCPRELERTVCSSRASDVNNESYLTLDWLNSLET